MTNSWLFKDYILPNYSSIKDLLYSSLKWQIFSTTHCDNVLIVNQELIDKWCQYNFIDYIPFEKIKLESKNYYILHSHEKYFLLPIEKMSSPKNKTDALSFALSLRESRKLCNKVSFHNALYVEQYSRLLPVWTDEIFLDDETVLGTWITGGVTISIHAFRKASALNYFLSANDLIDIINAACLSIPSETFLFFENHSLIQLEEDEQNYNKGSVEIENFFELYPSDIEHSNKKFQLPGCPKIEQFFNDNVIDIIFNPDYYQAMGIHFPSGIVLYGPPGCGKTFAVEKLIEFMNWPSYIINSYTISSTYIHENSKKISELFDKAIYNAPSIIVIDEMEAFLTDRRLSTEISEFLRRISEAISKKVLILGMTNLIELIDPAILRRGRFDSIIEIEMPSRANVTAFIHSLLSKLPKESNLDLNKVFDILTGKPFSDAAFVVREAARFAAKTRKKRLDQSCFDLAIMTLNNKIQKQIPKIGFV